MSWITENPWPGIMGLAGAGVVLLIVGTGRSKLAAVICVLLAVALYVAESMIVTTGEQLEANLNQMLEGFRNADTQVIASHLSPEAQSLKDTAEEGLTLVDVSRSFHIKDVETTVSDDGSSAWVDLRGNGLLTVKASNTPYHAATRWKTLWKKQSDGAWKLAEVHRLNPVNGDEIGILTRQ